jgi:hypothetical protein
MRHFLMEALTIAALTSRVMAASAGRQLIAPARLADQPSAATITTGGRATKLTPVATRADTHRLSALHATKFPVAGVNSALHRQPLDRAAASGDTAYPVILPPRAVSWRGAGDRPSRRGPGPPTYWRRVLSRRSQSVCHSSPEAVLSRC